MRGHWWEQVGLIGARAGESQRWRPMRDAHLPPLERTHLQLRLGTASCSRAPSAVLPTAAASACRNRHTGERAGSPAAASRRTCNQLHTPAAPPGGRGPRYQPNDDRLKHITLPLSSGASGAGWWRSCWNAATRWSPPRAPRRRRRRSRCSSSRSGTRAAWWVRAKRGGEMTVL